MLSFMTWDPWQDVMAIHATVNRLLEEAFGDRRRLAPAGSVGTLALDMYETPEAVVAKARVPGARPEDIQIDLRDGSLTIRGHIPSDAEREEAGKYTWIVHELGHGDFARSITLSSAIDPEKVEATFENGVLTLTMPKLESARPRQIPIKTAAALSAPRKSK